MSVDPPSHPYDTLTPQTILEAVETFQWRCTGGLLALNSYENRVYRVDIEDGAPVVAKFYRPGRWSDEAIIEEHDFERELADHEIPAVAPLIHPDGASLNRYGGFRFALFSWRGGRALEINGREDRIVFGRFIGRLHRLGMAQSFEHRMHIGIEEFGRNAVSYLLEEGFVPAELRANYRALSDELLEAVATAFTQTAEVRWIRLHGDCHLGNVLATDSGPCFVDFDDCLMGPAIQDIWMLLSGEGAEQEIQLAEILTGYTQFAEFNPAELLLVEPLRSLRLLHYSAWLARRWHDPAFPRSFPWFNTPRYWEDQLSMLREQIAALDQPPLDWISL
jgi:Ser/Thr protein kinase RdoA (MazF antagonist)